MPGDNRVTITLVVDDQGSVVLERAAKRATESLGKQAAAGDQLKRSFDSITAAAGPMVAHLADMAGRVAAATSSFAGLATGLVGGAAAVVGFAKHMGDSIEHFDNLSVQTGLSVAALQSFEQAAKEAGEAPDTLARGFGKVTEAIAEVLKGNAAAGASFHTVGVDLAQMARGGATTEQVLGAVAQGLSRIDDPTRRAAAATDLFGIKGRAMTVVLDAIAKEGLPAYIQKMRDAGVVTDEKTNAMAREFDQMFDAISRAMTGWGNQFKALLVDVIQATGTLVENLKAIPSQIKVDIVINLVGDQVREFFAFIGRNLPGRGHFEETARGLSEFRREQALDQAEADRIRRAAAVDEARQRVAGPGVTFVGAPVVLGVKEMLGGLGETIDDVTKAIEAGLTAALQNTAADLEKLRKETDEAREGLEHWGADLEGAGRQQLGWNEEVNRSASNLSMFGDQVKVADEFTLKLGNTFGQLTRPVFETGERFRLTGEEADQAAREIKRLEAAFRDIEQFSDIELGVPFRAATTEVKKFETEIEKAARSAEFALSDVFAGRDIKGAIADFGRTVQRQFADMMSSAVMRSFQQLFTKNLGEATTPAAALIDDFFTGLRASGGDLVTAFQTLSATSLQTAQALAGAAGTMVGTLGSGAAFGTGEGQATGSAVGGAVGGIAGAAVGTYISPGVGTVVGAAAGSAIGSFIGGAIGSLFDSSPNPFDAIQTALVNSFREGLLQAVETGNVEAGFAIFEAGVKQAVLTGVIQAMTEQAIIKDALNPLLAAMGDAFSQRLGPQAFRDRILPFVEQFKDSMQTLRPLFGEMFDVLFHDILPALNGSATATDDWRTRMTGVTEATRDVGTAVGGVTDALYGTTDPAQQLADTMAQMADPNDPDAPMMAAIEGATALTEQFDTATLAAAGINEELAKIPGELTTTVNVVYRPPGAPPTGAGEGRLHGGYITGFPAGGLVPGFTRGFDHIPALLDAGEFVVNSAATRRFRPILEAINLGGAPSHTGSARPSLPASRRAQGEEEDPALMREQNRLLRELLSVVRRRGGGAPPAVL